MSIRWRVSEREHPQKCHFLYFLERPLQQFCTTVQTVISTQWSTSTVHSIINSEHFSHRAQLSRMTGNMNRLQPCDSTTHVANVWEVNTRQWVTSLLVWRRAVPTTAVNATRPRLTVGPGTSRVASRTALKRSTAQHHSSAHITCCTRQRVLLQITSSWFSAIFYQHYTHINLSNTQQYQQYLQIHCFQFSDGTCFCISKPKPVGRHDF